MERDSVSNADESLTLYSYPDDGYELMLPKTWEVTTPILNGNSVPGIRQFGPGTGSRGALMVSIGDPDGSIRLCAPYCIEAHELKTLDDLLGAVFTRELAGPPLDSPYGPIPRNRFPMVVLGETTLAGEPAGLLRPDDRGFGLGDTVYQHIYAFHDGHPVVVSVQWDAVRFGPITQEVLSQILESFRFLD